jgi:Peptidase family M23
VAAEQVFVRFAGDERDLVRAARRSDEALGQVIDQVDKTATVSVESAVRQRRAQEAIFQAYQRTAREAKRGSVEQIEADRLAAQAARKLGIEYQEAGRKVSFFGRDLGRAERGALAGSGAFRGLGRSMVFASGAFIGAAGFTSVVRDAVHEAIDLNAELHRSDVTFGRSSRTVRAWSKTTADAFGLARGESLKWANQYGAMLRSLGVGQAQAAKMSRQLVERAADIASLRNIDPNIVLTAFTQGLAGRGRALRQYGIVLDDTRLKAEALSSGIVKSTVDLGKVRLAQDAVAIATAKLADARSKYAANSTQVHEAEDRLAKAEAALENATAGSTGKLTAQQKALAAQQIILKDSANAAGEFGRNQGRLSEQLKKAHAEVKNMEEELGQALIPVLTRLLRHGTEWLSDSKHQEEVQHDLKEAIRLVSEALEGMYQVGKTLAPVLEGVTDAVGGTKDAVELLLAFSILKKLGLLKAAIGALGTSAETATGAEAVGAAGAGSGVLGLVAALAALSAYKQIKIGIQILYDFKQGHGVKALEHALSLIPGYGSIGIPGTKYQVPGLAHWYVKGGKWVFGVGQGDGSKPKGRNAVYSDSGSYPLSEGGALVGRPGQGTHSRTERGYIWQDDDAVDIEMRPGAKVLAVADGYLTGARYGGDSGRFSGWGVTLVADNGDEYYYKHMRYLYFQPGYGKRVRVRRGQVIGAGTTTGHLHFAKKGAQTTQDVLGSPAAPGRPDDRGGPRPTDPAAGHPGGAGGGATPSRPPTELTVAQRRKRQDPGLAIVPGKLTAEQERVANLIYSTALAQGATPTEALAMVAAAYAESKLNPRAKGGGLFQINAAGNPKTYALYMKLLRRGYDPTTAAVMAMVSEFIKVGKGRTDPAEIAALAERPSATAIRRAGYPSTRAFYAQSLGSIFGFGDSGGYGITSDKTSGDRQKMLTAVDFILKHLDRVLPQARDRLRALAAALRAQIVAAVTEDDLNKLGGRFDRLVKIFTRAAQVKVDRQAAAKDIQALVKLYNTLPDDLKTDLAPKMAKLRELLSKATTPKDIDRLRKSLEQMQKAVDDAMSKVRDRFDKAWGRFKDRVLELFDKGVVGRIAIGVEFSQHELERATAQKQIDRARGQIAGIDAGGLTDIEQQIRARGLALQEALTQYYNAQVAGNRDEQTRAAAQLAEAWNQYNSINRDGLTDQENLYADAWDRLLDGIQKVDEQQVADEQKKWEDLTGEQRQGLEDMLDDLGEKLASGKITVAEARKQIAAEFEKYGIDINGDLANVLGQPFQDAFTSAITELTKALEELIKVLDGTKKKVDETAAASANAVGPIDAAARAAHGTGPVAEEEPHALGGFVRGGPRTRRYALGGLVPNAPGYGDRVSASLTPGELVLTRAMEGNLSRQLSAAGGGGVTWTGDVVVHGHVLTDKDLRDLFRDELKRFGRLNGGDVYGGFVTK